MKRLGRYEVVGLLGEGAWGHGLEAVQHGPGGLRRTVALKVLREGGTGLRREALLGGLLRHPSLVLRELGSRHSEGFVLATLGELYRMQGRIEEARTHHERALLLLSEAGDRRSQGFVLTELGTLLRMEGQLEHARARYTPRSG